jgi:hypothetical protein
MLLDAAMMSPLYKGPPSRRSGSTGAATSYTPCVDEKEGRHWEKIPKPPFAV